MLIVMRLKNDFLTVSQALLELIAPYQPSKIKKHQTKKPKNKKDVHSTHHHRNWAFYSHAIFKHLLSGKSLKDLQKAGTKPGRF